MAWHGTALSPFVDLAPWVSSFRAPHWRTLTPSVQWDSGHMPPCKIGATDCEAIDALQLLFYKHQGGVTLELGGLDGVIMSETKLLSDVAHFHRIVIDASPHHRAVRQKLHPAVVGVTAAVCSSPGFVHYIGGNHSATATAGVIEFMSNTFLKKWYPQLLATKLKAEVGRAGEQIDWGEVDFKAQKVPSIEVICTPLTTILDYVGISHIHFFVLDVEGAELEILRTIDFRRIRFGVLVVEAWSPLGSRPLEYSGQVSSFMLNQTGGQYRQLFPDAIRQRNLWFMHRDFTAYAKTPREVGWGFHSWRQPKGER